MNFETVFDRLIGHEGGWSDDPRDPGNWTGGRPNVGQLKGTNFRNYVAVAIFLYKQRVINDTLALSIPLRSHAENHG